MINAVTTYIAVWSPKWLLPWLRIAFAPIQILKWVRGHAKRSVIVCDFSRINSNKSRYELFSEIANQLQMQLPQKLGPTSYFDLVFLCDPNYNWTASDSIRLGLMFQKASSVSWLTTGEWTRFRQVELCGLPDENIFQLPIPNQTPEARLMPETGLPVPTHYLVWAHHFLKNLGPYSYIVAALSTEEATWAQAERIASQYPYTVIVYLGSSVETKGQIRKILRATRIRVVDADEFGWSIFERAAIAQKADVILGKSHLQQWLTETSRSFDSRHRYTPTNPA